MQNRNFDDFIMTFNNEMANLANKHRILSAIAPTEDEKKAHFLKADIFGSIMMNIIEADMKMAGSVGREENAHKLSARNSELYEAYLASHPNEKRIDFHIWPGFPVNEHSPG